MISYRCSSLENYTMYLELIIHVSWSYYKIHKKNKKLKYIFEFIETWKGKDESKNKEQKYDEEMIREEKRSEVEEELRRQVDVLMREELDLLKIVSIQSSNSAGKIIAYFLGCGKRQGQER